MKNQKSKFKTQKYGVNYIIIRYISFALLFFSFALFVAGCGGKKEEGFESIKVTRGNIKAEISSTGIVEPRNRLEIKPPVAGRIDSVLVSEGQRVTKGQILAWMSSSDRAALLDAARSKGQEEMAYWEDVYKSTPVMAPLNGFIIQRAVEPGQSVATGDPILVMADYLIVKAQVDETDIGNIRVGQKVNIELDAFQGQGTLARVQHIAYESKTVNNVNIYEVDVLPDAVPAFFRAGMSATVYFVLEEKPGVLLVPLKAVKKIGTQAYVFVKGEKDKDPKAVQVDIGLENMANAEVVSGLSESDEVVIPTIKMVNELNAKFEHRRGPANPLQKRSQ